MPDYDPDNPQTPMDKWWESNKRRFLPLLLIAIPCAFVFQYKLLAIAFEEMPGWLFLGGCFSLVVVVIGIRAWIEAAEYKSRP